MLDDLFNQYVKDMSETISKDKVESKLSSKNAVTIPPKTIVITKPTDNGKYMEISSIYNFRCDPDLGIWKAACRRIPCACLTCLEILNTPWEKYIVDKEQPRYGMNERFLY